MKPVVVVFGEKPGILERVSALGFEPFLVSCLPVSGNIPHLAIDPEDAAWGRFNADLFLSIPLHRVVGIIPVYENLVEIAAHFREAFFPAFPGLDPAQALVVRDKIAMKSAMKEWGIPTPAFMPLDAQTSWAAMTSALGEEVLVKPRRDGGACGITVLKSEVDWNHWKKTTKVVDSFYAEKFISGIREFCCDTLVASSRIVAQFPGEYTVDCLQSNHARTGFGVNFPGFASNAEVQRMKDLARHFVEKLGVRDGFCHIEFLNQNGEIYFGEIGIRVPGGLQMPAESLQCGTDLLDWYLRLHIPVLHSTIPVISTPKGYVGYYLYPKSPGIVLKMESNFDRPWIVESAVKVQVGDEVGKYNESVSNIGHCIFKSQSLEALRENSFEARGLFQVVLRAN